MEMCTTGKTKMDSLKLFPQGLGLAGLCLVLCDSCEERALQHESGVLHSGLTGVFGFCS